jgi:hypothetical protein
MAVAILAIDGMLVDADYRTGSDPARSRMLGSHSLRRGDLRRRPAGPVRLESQRQSEGKPAADRRYACSALYAHCSSAIAAAM